MTLMGALTQVLQRGHDVEVAVERAWSYDVERTRSGAVDRSASKHAQAAVSVFGDGRVGHASTTDLSVPGLVRAARRAQWSMVPSRRSTQQSGQFSRARGAGSWSEQELDDLSQVIADRLGAGDERAWATWTVRGRARSSTTEYLTSYGDNRRASRSDIWLHARATSHAGTAHSSGSYAAGAAGQLDACAVADRLAEQAPTAPGAPAGIDLSQSVLELQPDPAAVLLAYISSACQADAYQTGSSFLTDQLGCDVAAPQVVLHDDPTQVGAPLSYDYDAEGTRTQDTRLIDGGMLAGLLHDRCTAAAHGVASTGNSLVRDFGARPFLTPSNVHLEAFGDADPSAAVLSVTELRNVAAGTDTRRGVVRAGFTGFYSTGAGTRFPVSGAAQISLRALLTCLVHVGADRHYLLGRSGFAGARLRARPHPEITFSLA